MIIKNILGLLFCTALFCMGFVLNGNFSLYFNLSGLLIVLGGTLAATLLSFRWEQISIAARVTMSSYNRQQKTEKEIIQTLIDLSVKSRAEGILSLQKEEEDETSILFLRRALGCLVDGYRVDQIQEILSTEMYFFRLRRDDLERVLKSIADYFPTFGIIGSVVGLITMLSGIGDTAVILKAVPIALTSTLYGLIFSNFFFLPFAANLRERTNHELLLQKIISEGIIAIDSEINPIVLKTKLDSYLTPSERTGDRHPPASIRERFNLEEESPTESGRLEFNLENIR
ncbi:motility protein A [Desulfopila inferna]|uniref:motility protein A n=1 Tax=Desulfopila inferna TaxID=468528 RepID=UPI0019653933|nr:MotA/TolQ/ExbB proton channel family protein [Desulfopila inferna]MBM9605889.1 MotA/TolQ/ExbB proton channel family protein [Desulfopila inferna]